MHIGLNGGFWENSKDLGKIDEKSKGWKMLTHGQEMVHIEVCLVVRNGILETLGLIKVSIAKED